MTFISNYSLSENYANHLRRMAADVIDIAVLVLFSTLLNFYLNSNENAVAFQLLSAFQLVLPWFYFTAMESSLKGATIGKMLLECRVADTNGNPISFGRAAIRAIPKSIPFLWPGYIAVFFTKRQQAFHDLLARTVVYQKSE